MIGDDPYVKMQSFLRGLEHLTKRHGLEITATAQVRDLDSGELLMRHLAYCRPCRQYGPKIIHKDC